MALKKRTYSLPAETVERFERRIPAGERSGILAKLIHDWLERQRLDQLRQEIIEGCREMAAVYREVEKEFHPLEEEAHRALDAAETRRRGSGSARSRRGA